MTIFDKVGCTAVSMAPLCMSQRCQWYRCTCHSGVNDTAVHITAVSIRCATNFVDLLRKYEAIFKKALTRVSGARGSCLMKKTEVENPVSGSL
jgi:hypothetical protein